MFKIKSFLKKEGKSYRSLSPLSLISKVLEKEFTGLYSKKWTAVQLSIKI